MILIVHIHKRPDRITFECGNIIKARGCWSREDLTTVEEEDLEGITQEYSLLGPHQLHEHEHKEG